jgi:branched-chain amino acid transport system substrate-binding protein
VSGSTSRSERRALERREFLRLAGLSGATVGLAGVLAGCKSGATSSGTTRTIKLGYVSPQTGPLAPFGEADAFTIAGARTAFKDGIKVGGKSYPVQIVVKDSQSDPNRAGSVAADLINSDKADIVLVASTPETTNPVSDQCEANGVPCISTVAPWQPWFFRKPSQDPKTPYKWTYHFFWGLEDIIAVFEDMWGQVGNNKVLAALWPNDGDGNAWGDGKNGFPAALKPKGYKIVDPGRYQDGSDEFSPQISRFKQAGAQIVTGVPLPPDFTTFWKQAVQQGFKPKIATVGKALLFPSSVEALGDSGVGLSSEVWWTPSHPFKSSLTGQTARQLADAYTQATGKQWTQPIGFGHAIFEVVSSVLGRAASLDDRQAIVDAIKATKLDTIVGRLDWSAGPTANVAKTPLVGGQWRRGSGRYPFELMVISNAQHPEIPATGKLQTMA